MMEHFVDGRGLEPPEPFERCMEALVDLPSGDTLVVLLDRVPYPLFRILDRDGIGYEHQIRDDGAVEVRIRQP